MRHQACRPRFRRLLMTPAVPSLLASAAVALLLGAVGCHHWGNPDNCPENAPVAVSQTLPHDPDFAEFLALSNRQAQRYADREDAWAGSPFEWLKRRPSRQIGAIGEALVEDWLSQHGYTVTHSPDPDADRVVNGVRIEIKLSTLWSTGTYKFQQLRDQNYDFAVWIGVSPFDVHAWVVPKEEIIRLWKVEHVIHSQHNSGHGGTDTAWVDVAPAAPPDWLKPFGGTFGDALRLVRERLELRGAL